MTMPVQVALRKESVDRNLEQLAEECSELVSLSARRAWIEIERPLWRPWQQRVALRKESVDRNCNGKVRGKLIVSRSPQGERG